MTTTPCLVCGSDAGLFLVRRDVPVHQNEVCDTEDRARAVRRGDLEFCACEVCGFVFNRAFDAARMSYENFYDNDQSCSPLFRTHLDQTRDYLLNTKGLTHGSIVEVGCGRGEFIEQLVAAGSTSRGIGFDPAYAGPSTAVDGRVRFERKFFDGDAAHVAADAVISRHVIEHVADPVAFVKAIRKSFKDDSGSLFLETPCVEWILRNRVVWDFFYEHCSLFSKSSIEVLLARCGFRVTEVRHVFGGQYLWIEAVPAAAVSVSTHSDVARLAREYASAERLLVDGIVGRLEHLSSGGGVAIWGAGAKGVTLAQLADPDRKLAACLVDMNPRKQNRFVPATAHPIVDYRDLPRRGVRNALVVNPNYMEENRALVTAAGLDVQLFAPEA